MLLDHPTAVNLARLIGGLRSWDFAGTLASIGKVEGDNPVQICQTVLRCADDPEAKTPGAMGNAKYRTEKRKYEPAPVVRSNANSALDDRQRLIDFRSQEAIERERAASSERVEQIRAEGGWARPGNFEERHPLPKQRT